MLNIKKTLTKILNALTIKTSSAIPPSGYTFRKNIVYKVGNVVHIELEWANALSGGAYRSLGSLPSGFYRTDDPIVSAQVLFLNANGYVKIDTDGSLSVYPNSNVAGVYIFLTYILE